MVDYTFFHSFFLRFFHRNFLSLTYSNLSGRSRLKCVEIENVMKLLFDGCV